MSNGGPPSAAPPRMASTIRLNSAVCNAFKILVAAARSPLANRSVLGLRMRRQALQCGPQFRVSDAFGRLQQALGRAVRKLGRMPATLAKVRAVYAERAMTMGNALRRELGDAIEFVQQREFFDMAFR